MILLSSCLGLPNIWNHSTTIGTESDLEINTTETILVLLELRVKFGVGMRRQVIIMRGLKCHNELGRLRDSRKASRRR